VGVLAGLAAPLVLGAAERVHLAQLLEGFHARSVARSVPGREGLRARSGGRPVPWARPMTPARSRATGGNTR
jgi:hypothetical protein